MNFDADLIFSAALLGVMVLAPFYSRREQSRLERDLETGQSDPRVRFTRRVISVQWVTAALLLVGWMLSSYTSREVFLVPGWTGSQWLAVALGLLVGGILVAQTLVLRGRDDQLARIHDRSGTTALLGPQTTREQRYFDALSLTAAVCEEFIYRGLLLGVLASWIGLWPAVVASTVLFGLAHADQGVRGIALVGLFGAVAALLTVFSGSIYLAIVVHAIGDLSQGRMLAMAARAAGQRDRLASASEERVH